MGRREHFDGGANEHITGSVHLPPTPEAVEHIHNMEMSSRMHALDEEVERKRKGVETAQARNSPYALGGKRKDLKKHLEHVHGAWPEDVQSETEELARWHKAWHRDSDWDHSHG